MSWNQQQNGGNGGQKQYKMPDLGRGRLRPGDKSRNPKAPDFRGLVNCDGHIISVAMWYESAKQGQNGQMMPESWSVVAETFDPNKRPGNGQQPGQHPPQQQGYAAQAPTYAASPQQAAGYAATPPQGYAPAPGYQPPQGQPQAAPPRWGGQPGQPQGQQAQGGGYTKEQLPF